MNDYTHFDDSLLRGDEHMKLAHWLQQVLQPVAQEPSQGSLAPAGHDFHLRFYGQLPDFIMALLRKDAHAALRYAPLLYHLAGCPTCRGAYLDLYASMRYAVRTGDTQPIVNAGTRPLATIPTGTLVTLCQLLISQADALLSQALQDSTDGSAAARSLLQLAMRISASITQSGMRGRALQGLVRVATLFDASRGLLAQEPPAHTYSSLSGLSGGPRHGATVRGAETAPRSAGKPPDQPAIYLQAHALAGSITQHEDVLVLQLHDLDERLRGRYLSISVPLGSLIEPIRWQGGNPRAIRSIAPVDREGILSTTLGETALRLSRAEERSLLEVMFQLIEVRPTD
jgi:hypothetical protein